MTSAEKEPLNNDDGLSTISISLHQLKKLMENRGPDCIEALKNLGGIDTLCKLLSTNYETGLPDREEELCHRRQTFGANYIPPKKPKTFFELMWDALQDTTLIILIISAIVSLVLALIPKDSAHKDDGPAEWIEGLAILMAVLLVVVVTAFNDYSKEKQFRGLQKKIEEDQRADVIRSGVTISIPVAEIVVGDILLVKYGDSIPADGIIVQSNDLRVDESSMTGESNIIKKGVLINPNVMAGTSVIEGTGRVVVTAVGLNSQTGLIFTLLGAADNKGHEIENCNNVSNNHEKKNSINTNADDVHIKDNNVSPPTDSIEDQTVTSEESPLQSKLTKLTIQIGKLGTLMAVLTILALTVRFVFQELYDGRGISMLWLTQFVRFLIIGITVLVVAVPEGLPLAVTISLAYSVKKMMKDHNLVRHLDACETMGSATTICSDKTGTLTKNRMTVTQIYTDGHLQRQVADMKASETFLTILGQSIAINSSYTSQIVPGADEKIPKHQGNKTECGLLGLLIALGVDYKTIRKSFPEMEFVKVYTFNSSRKSMSTVIKTKDNNRLRLLMKGASEVVLKKCTHIMNANGDVRHLSRSEVELLTNGVIKTMASDALRTITVAYKDFPLDAEPNFDEEAATTSGLTCLAITGIEDPVREEVPDSISKCQQAGINVLMVTGDNVNTARSIALKCGIIKPNDDFLVLEGKEFSKRIRNKEGKIEQCLVDKLWPRLRVLARSSPIDKHTLVKGIIDSRLSANREVVAVTGDGTNDAPALKKADVGFAMGIAGTDVAKEASDIILTDDNFTSIVKAVMWGRNVYDSISKFLQFQLTVNLVAIILAFAGALLITDSPLRAIQMLWVNLIMDTFASLALATETPTEELLERLPYGRTKPLISRTMIKNILGQTIYQLIVLFTFLLFGPQLFSIKSGIYKYREPTTHFTMIFNVFVFMQIFNEINSRKIHGERNVFQGIHRNSLFNIILFGTAIVQVLLVEVGGSIFFTTPLKAYQWMWCLVFGVGSLLWGQVLTTIPTRLLPKFLSFGPSNDVTDMVSVPAQDVSLEVENEPPKRGKVLWMRGVTRIQQQLRVVNAFRNYYLRRKRSQDDSFTQQLLPSSSSSEEGASEDNEKI